MSDPHLRDADPQHYANPNYQGVDFFALDFIKQREAVIDKLKANQIRADKEDPETTVMVAEKDVQARIGESNQRYAQGALKREIINSFYNHPLILHDFATGRGKNLTPNSGMGPALIIGSGPTLDKCHDLIRGWKGGLFCSSSQAITMAALGKDNFNIAIVDVKTESDELLPLEEWEGRNCRIITHPGVDPEILQVWRGAKLYFRITVHNYPFYTEIQPLAYPMIPTTLYVYGCAVSCQITMAALMGYNPLFLCGCDFGFPGEQDRFRSYSKVDGKWLLSEPTKMKYVRHAKVTYRNGCPSDTFQSYYKQTFFNVWRLSLADVFRVGDEGGLYEVPSVTKEEVAQTGGDIIRDKYISNKDKIDICERYLLHYGTFTFEYPNNQVEFVVFEDEARDMPRYIQMCNNAFAQSKMPGVLNLEEERSRIAYLRDDALWEEKEKRWQWATKSQQSLTETTPEASSASGSESTETTGKTS
ncbi:MAG: DUF115 domain-containing protein [Candidatus Omnitrophica bacterium]|nr:DUF115 domain-containing protein [Candidatus Omnitrophota bacterium]